MHVVLVGAEFEENLAVRYLRGALEHAGHRVTTVVFNEPADSERAAREIAESGAPLAGLSMVFTYRAREFARLAERTRELGFSGHVIAGGHFAAMHAAELLSDVPALDSVAIGEGELILCQLAESLADPSHVSGLVWRNGEHIQQNADAVKPPDLDVLPFPPRKQPFDDYLGIPITNILSSRGCSRSCAFCSIAAWHKLCGGERLRLRSPEQVAEEMAELHRRGVRVFNFHDDNFVLDDKAAMHRRLDELDAALRARGVTSPIAFAIKCRPDTVDVELFGVEPDQRRNRVAYITAGEQFPLYVAPFVTDVSPPLVTDPGPDREAERQRAERRRRILRTSLWVGTGLTAASAVALTVMGSLTLYERRKFAEEKCAPMCTDEQGNPLGTADDPLFPFERQERFETYQLTTNVLIGVTAGLGVATALVGVFAFRKRGPDQSRAPARVGVRGPGLVVRW